MHRLILLLLILLRLLRKRLNAPTNLEATLMSGNVRLKWNNASEFNDGAPAEIARTIISARTGSLPFTPIAVLTDPAELVPGAETSRLFPNQPGGTWDYEVKHEDPSGQVGASATTQLVVPRGTLNAPTNLTATLEP